MLLEILPNMPLNRGHHFLLTLYLHCSSIAVRRAGHFYIRCTITSNNTVRENFNPKLSFFAWWFKTFLAVILPAIHAAVEGCTRMMPCGSQFNRLFHSSKSQWLPASLGNRDNTPSNHPEFGPSRLRNPGVDKRSR